MPASAHANVPMTKETFQFREYRTPTKHLLCSLANSLQQAMPSGWTLQKARPSNPLLPTTFGCERLAYQPLEMQLMDPRPSDDCCLHFTWDPETLESRPDHYVSEDFVRLVFSSDEGTEARCEEQGAFQASTEAFFSTTLAEHACSSWQGWVGFQHLSSQNLWVLMWPDVFHKAARKSSSAIRRLDQGSEFLRRLMALFRFSRGPFKSSRFGRLILDSRERLCELLQQDIENDFISMFLPGMAKDVAGWANCSSNLESGFDAHRALQWGTQRLPGSCISCSLLSQTTF